MISVGPSAQRFAWATHRYRIVGTERDGQERRYPTMRYEIIVDAVDERLAGKLAIAFRRALGKVAVAVAAVEQLPS